MSMPAESAQPNPQPQQPKKAWYLRWWVWAIAAVLVIGTIDNMISGDDVATEPTPTASSEMATPVEGATTPVETEASTPSETATENAKFEARFDTLCSALEEFAQTSTGTVSCQDADTWQANHEQNAEAFPYEYRDVNYDFGDGTAQFTVIADATAFDYFKVENTCENLYGLGVACAVGEAGSNIVFSVFSQDTANQGEVDAMSTTLQELLSEIP